MGNEDLETLVEAQHIGSALERVLAERRDIAALPVVKGRTAVETEETHLFDLAEIPCLGDVEECAERRPRQLLAIQCFCRRRHNGLLRNPICSLNGLISSLVPKRNVLPLSLRDSS